MPIFIERFLLPLLAAVIVTVIIVNPLKLDVRQQISLSVAVIALAYFCAHTIHRRGGRLGGTDPLQRSQTAQERINTDASDKGPSRAANRSVAGNAGLQTSSIAGRDLSPSVVKQMKSALEQFPASEIAIYTLRRRSERLKFAAEIATVFRESGWTLVVRNDHAPSDPDGVSLLDSRDNEKSGVSLLKYLNGDNRFVLAPTQIEAVMAALRAGRIQHQEETIGADGSIFRSPITTGVPVLFVGPQTDIILP